MRRSRPPKLTHVQRERNREATTIGLLVSNFLHDERLLDPTAVAERIEPLTVDTVLDGDIPVRILVKKEHSGPTWITWKLWPDEAGRPTRGDMVIHRLGVTKAFLDITTYQRAMTRSPRVGQIRLPDAKWGLGSEMLTELGVVTSH